MRINHLTIIAAISVAFLYSCGGKTSDQAESLTGWDDNDVKGWYFSGEKESGVKGPGMVFVQGGTFTMGQTKDNVMHDWNNTPNRQQVRSFYMAEIEVTNRDYKMYLDWLRKNFDPSFGDYRNIYDGALPDSLVWRNYLSQNEQFVNGYFREDAYDFYPVVGVNWLQAVRYAEWLTDRVNEKILIDQGILSKELYTYQMVDSVTQFNNPNPAFSYKLYKEKGTEMFGEDTRESEIFEQNTKKGNKQAYSTYNEKWKAAAKKNSHSVSDYRLPTEVEWEFSALALIKNRDYNKYEGKTIPEFDLRKKKGGKKGEFMANIKHGKGDYSGIAGWANDGYAITSPVRAFSPNELGLYDMYGNVAEWTADVYRPIVDEEASDLNYYRGNVFKKTMRIDGQAEIVGIEMEYDTLDDGRLLYRQLPGQPKEEHTDDYRNYRDGDYQSLINPKAIGEGDEERVKTDDIYNTYKRELVVQEDGSVKLKKQKKEVTTDISDENRVIKGASWNDRAYWMDPAQRRYMRETQSASWLGFRVAHDNMGADIQGKNKAH